MGGLLFVPHALLGIPQLESEQLLEKTDWLWDNRKVILHQPLNYELSGYYKRRKGKYRIIYSYDEIPDEMVIHLVGTRDSIYKDAIKKFR